MHDRALIGHKMQMVQPINPQLSLGKHRRRNRQTPARKRKRAPKPIQAAPGQAALLRHRAQKKRRPNERIRA